MKKKLKGKDFEALLVYQCPECKQIKTVEGFDNIFLEAESQWNSEGRSFTCQPCQDAYEG